MLYFVQTYFGSATNWGICAANSLNPTENTDTTFCKIFSNLHFAHSVQATYLQVYCTIRPINRACFPKECKPIYLRNVDDVCCLWGTILLNMHTHVLCVCVCACVYIYIYILKMYVCMYVHIYRYVCLCNQMNCIIQIANAMFHLRSGWLSILSIMNNSTLLVAFVSFTLLYQRKTSLHVPGKLRGNPLFAWLSKCKHESPKWNQQSSPKSQFLYNE